MIKKIFQRRLARGITLIEVIIVLVILAILILLVISFFRNQILKANDAKRKADILRMKDAIEEYEKDHNCYPQPTLVTCDPGTGLAPYLEKTPCDPVSEASYVYDYDSNGSCPSWYRIYAKLDYPLESTSDPNAVVSCGPGGVFNYSAGSPNAPACQYQDITGRYGCKSGVCVPIHWNTQRPGPECDPNFTNLNCGNRCNNPSYECKTWKP